MSKMVVPNDWSLIDLNFLKLEKHFEDVKGNLKHFCILRFYYMVFFPNIPAEYTILWGFHWGWNILEKQGKTMK